MYCVFFGDGTYLTKSGNKSKKISRAKPFLTIEDARDEGNALGYDDFMIGEIEHA